MTPGLQLFGTAHLATLASMVLLAFVVPLWARRWSPGAQRVAAVLVAVGLVGYEPFKVLIRVGLYDARLIDELPLHLCSVAALATAATLWWRSYRVYEVAWFWSMGGALTAMLTPDLVVGFPHPVYLMFFASHGLNLLGAVYATVVYGFRPTFGSLLRMGGVTLIYVAVVGLVNWVLGTNYMYLAAKPRGASPLDYLGPWPWYLPGMVAIGLVVCVLLWLPFALVPAWRRRDD